MNGILVVLLMRFWLLWSALAILILCAIADTMHMRKVRRKKAL